MKVDRCCIIMLFLVFCCIVPLTAHTAHKCNSPLRIGDWTGEYTAPQGPTKLILSIKNVTTDGQITAIFKFSALSSNPHVPSGSFNMKGNFDLNTCSVVLQAGSWVMGKRPQNYSTVGLEGILSADSTTIKGRIVSEQFNDKKFLFEVKQEIQRVIFTRRGIDGVLAVSKVDLSKLKDNAQRNIENITDNLFNHAILSAADHVKIYGLLLGSVRSLKDFLGTIPDIMQNEAEMPQIVAEQMRANKFKIQNNLICTKDEGNLKITYNIYVYPFSSGYNFGVVEYAEKQSWGKWKPSYIKIMTGFNTKLQ